MVLGGLGRLAAVLRPQRLACPVGAAEGQRATESLARHDRLADPGLEPEGRRQARPRFSSAGGDGIYAELRAASGLYRFVAGNRRYYPERCRRTAGLCSQLPVA